MPNRSHPVIVKSGSLIRGEPYSHRTRQNSTEQECKSEITYSCSVFVLSVTYFNFSFTSLSLSESDTVSSPLLYFLIIYLSYMTAFDCQINRLRKRSFVTCGKTAFISIDKESLCFLFSSVISGVTRSPPHWPCHCPRGPDPAFPVFLCICWEFSTDFSAQLHSFILPPPLNPYFLCLPDPSLGDSGRLHY